MRIRARNLLKRSARGVGDRELVREAFFISKWKLWFAAKVVARAKRVGHLGKVSKSKWDKGVSGLPNSSILWLDRLGPG